MAFCVPLPHVCPTHSNSSLGGPARAPFKLHEVDCRTLRCERRGDRHCARSASSLTESASDGADGAEGAWDEKYGEQYGQLAYASTLEQGNREDMQDYLDVVQKGSGGFLFAGVFDGHGGERAADYLSKNLYKTFIEGFSEGTDVQQCSGEELSSHLTAAFAKTDKELITWLNETQEGDEALAGSTATVVLARRDKVVVANVGDSRAVLCKKGRPHDLSAEHRVYGRSRIVDDEIARVESIGGWIADGRVCDILAVSRAFGDPQFKGDGLQRLLKIGIEGGFWDEAFAETVKFTGDPVVSTPDVTEITVSEDDEFIILASDGLWDVMSSKEAVDFARKDLKKGRSLQSIADKLANIAMRRYSMDNIAIILIDLGGGKADRGKKKTGWSFLGV